MSVLTSELGGDLESPLGPRIQWEMAIQARERFLRLLDLQSAFRAIERAAGEADPARAQEPRTSPASTASATSLSRFSGCGMSAMPNLR